MGALPRTAAAVTPCASLDFLAGRPPSVRAFRSENGNRSESCHEAKLVNEIFKRRKRKLNILWPTRAFPISGSEIAVDEKKYIV